MYALVPHHVVALTGIYEEVRLGAGLGTGIDELKSMLRNYGRVVHAYYNLQLAFRFFALSSRLVCL